LLCGLFALLCRPLALLEALVFRSQTGVLYDILNAEQAFTADRQILKDIMLANQELDILRRKDIMKQFKVIYDTIDTVVDLL
jgi:F420-dependent methylenetetrahydromethanopterin dehydrogenase